MLTDSKQIQGLLKKVSRSFYLSMHYLPPAMRQPIALGYLWARLSDTVADTQPASQDLRLEMLEALRQSISQGQWDVSNLQPMMTYLTPHIAHLGEKQLALETQMLQHLTLQLQPAYQNMLQTVMQHILAAQTQDLAFFSVAGAPVMMNETQLEHYCYQVAGSVGEFWTEVGYEACADFSELPPAHLRRLGRLYGEGLQLVNILRDYATDQTLGRCYLPIEGRDEAQIETVYREWLQKAQERVGKGLEYAAHVKPWRARSSSALPAYLGLETLKLLQANPVRSMQQPQKISRGKVRRCVLKAMWMRYAPSV
jgi:farnesyl-diphosphate farnesyltransferase